MPVPFFQVDSFTPEPYKGNPAGVCILDTNRDEVWMQLVAKEVNLSETAFVVQKSEQEFDLRWFTPTTEVDLCGHATLAASHILWEQNILSEDKEAVFSTKSGLLACKKCSDKISMDFPSEKAEKAEAPKGLLEALNINPLYIGKNRMDYIIEVESEKIVRALNPDFKALKAVKTHRGIIITAKSDDEKYDFVSRFFAPAAGIDEDPVTGSAHCCLAPYWAEKLNKKEFKAYQASERGGGLDLLLSDDRVCITGKAVTVIAGKILH